MTVCLLFLPWSVVSSPAVSLNPDAVQINICRLDFEPDQLLHAPSLSTGFSDCITLDWLSSRIDMNKKK